MYMYKDYKSTVQYRGGKTSLLLRQKCGTIPASVGQLPRYMYMPAKYCPHLQKCSVYHRYAIHPSQTHIQFRLQFYLNALRGQMILGESAVATPEPITITLPPRQTKQVCYVPAL